MCTSVHCFLANKSSHHHTSIKLTLSPLFPLKGKPPSPSASNASPLFSLNSSLQHSTFRFFLFFACVASRKIFRRGRPWPISSTL